MRVALAAVADHRNLLSLDQIEIRVSIVIHSHVCSSLRERSLAEIVKSGVATPDARF